MPEPVIRTAGVIKRFGATVALDGMDLEVRGGEVHGFLGPNGAGKSTAIRILLGMLRADAGEAHVLGSDPWRDAVSLHRRLAYVPGDVALWPNLTGGEILDVMSRMRGDAGDARSARRRDELCVRFGLDPTRRARTYSRGNRQKVALIAALATEAELLLLDEPTAGLDPLMEAEFQDCIREECRDGRTVLLSSHILGQVEALATSISIIRRGRIVESGALADLRHLTRSTVTATTDASPAPVLELPGVHAPTIDGHHLRFEIDGEHLKTVMPTLTALGLTALTVHPPTLEQLLLRHYGPGDDR